MYTCTGYSANFSCPFLRWSLLRFIQNSCLVLPRKMKIEPPHRGGHTVQMQPNQKLCVLLISATVVLSDLKCLFVWLLVCPTCCVFVWTNTKYRITLFQILKCTVHSGGKSKEYGMLVLECDRQCRRWKGCTCLHAGMRRGQLASCCVMLCVYFPTCKCSSNLCKRKLFFTLEVGRCIVSHLNPFWGGRNTCC